MIINIISSRKGGGAEMLVNELHKIYLKKRLPVHSIFFSGNYEKGDKDISIFKLNPRSPYNIFLLRKLIKKITKNYRNKIIIHSHLTWPFYYTVLALLGFSDIKLIYTEHNTYNKRRKIPLFFLLERFFYSKYSKIICISKGTHDSLSKWVGPKISNNLITIMNGSRIFKRKSRSLIDNRLPELISIGSLTKQKNFFTTILAISKLRQKILKYTIIGEGKEKKKLKKIIKKNNLEHKVKLVSWTDDIRKYLYKSDIQLIPSIWEGFGLVAVEGMSSGIQVVASNVDGLKEVLGSKNPAVRYVNQAISVEEWIETIEMSIKDLHNFGSEKVSKFASLQANKYSLDKMAKSYLNLYNSINN